MSEQGTEQQLVVLDLAGEAYGLDIGTVREIIRMQSVTSVPDAPDFVEGVINLRGRVIPVVDLRRRFGLAVSEPTAESRIVVVDIGGDDIGVIVDAVTEVLLIAEDSIEEASSVVTTEHSYYIRGIAKVADQLLILLDIERALQETAAELGEGDAPAAGTEAVAAA